MYPNLARISFRRMHLCDDAAARESLPPDLCVDLSQCTLRWISKASASGKRKNVVEIKSSLLGIELNLHFDQHSDAAGWYHGPQKMYCCDAFNSGSLAHPMSCQPHDIGCTKPKHLFVGRGHYSLDPLGHCVLVSPLLMTLDAFLCQMTTDIARRSGHACSSATNESRDS